MVEDGMDFIVYSCNRNEHVTTMDTLIWHRTVLARCFVKILGDIRFAYMLYLRQQVVMSYCRMLQDVIDADMEETEKDLGYWSCFN